MTQTDFNKVVEEFLNKTKEVLAKKQAEYNLDEDRFKFFKDLAEIERCAPKQALFHCQAKHLLSYIDMVNSPEKFSKDLWFDKLGDLVNYCILLYGLLEDTDMFLTEKK